MLFVFRMAALGLHFVGASVLNLLLVLWRPFHPDNSRLCARMYAWGALPVLGLRVRRELSALPPPAQPFVVVANHQSNYDLFVHGSVVPRDTVSVGKSSLKWLPLFGQIYWLAGNVLIRRGHAQQAKQAMLRSTEAICQRNTSIWVFAEGTRNRGRGLQAFKKGAFQMAIAARAPIVLMCASTYVRSMRLNRWQSGHVLVRALPPVLTAGLTLDDLPELMQRCHALMRQCIDELDAQVRALDAGVPALGR
ncbi:MAG: 1-acylglycerol-3-phosphate O-acyltransferase [Rhodoferax sp.]